MKKEKDYTIALLIGLFLFACVASCKNEVRQVVNVEYFKEGDMLLPDYAIPDTLIVVDAVKLNKDMALIEQGFIDPTDGEIAKVFYSHCRIK